MVKKKNSFVGFFFKKKTVIIRMFLDFMVQVKIAFIVLFLNFRVFFPETMAVPWDVVQYLKTVTMESSFG